MRHSTPLFRFVLLLLGLVPACGARITAETAPWATGPTLMVQTTAATHTISDEIYGINFVDGALAAELKIPVSRWGGNATTRYNWKNNVSNRASDWFFMNVPDGAAASPSLVDSFVGDNMATGTKSLITVPLIGWTPKRRVTNSRDCGFPAAVYPNQRAFDGDWNCGNGLNPNGTPITGNNPTLTSMAIDETWVAEWVAHLVTRFGTAANGGVPYYALDNEPMLWHETHRDVHPGRVSYDELRDRTVQYAAAIKEADPTAKTFGPVLFGWTAYFYSAADAAGGGEWWNTRPDRMAHGDIPFVEWYLQQAAAYEQANGTRILDYLDLHFYPQNGVALTEAGSDATQTLRLRSTRALWDTEYTDESWIDEPVYLIPRMREWVDAYYPGTKLAITEYNWGGLEHINGALTQADILGIFGREQLDFATLWDAPANNAPGMFAFRLYRNYDGAGSAFGEQSLNATSTDQAKLAIYAARRNSDGALTLVVINKTNESLTSRLDLVGFGGGTAEVYRYSAADLSAIGREADMAVGVGGFSAPFPAQSITLFEVQAGKVEALFLPFVGR